MRDPADIYTKRGTPVIHVISRGLFILYFAFAIFTLEYHLFLNSTLSYIWLVYLLALYYLAERIHAFYQRKNIDLTFAFPLLLAIYLFNLGSMLLGAQEHFPIINRAEHLLSFILLTYVVWIFFLKYLPQEVWREHPYYTALIVLSVTSTAGVLNELVELLADALFNARLIGSRLDTPLDLLMNTLGAVLFLAARLIFISFHAPSTTPKPPAAS